MENSQKQHLNFLHNQSQQTNIKTSGFKEGAKTQKLCIGQPQKRLLERFELYLDYFSSTLIRIAIRGNFFNYNVVGFFIMDTTALPKEEENYLT